LTAYIVQKGDDDGDELAIDGGSAFELVWLVLVIRPLSKLLHALTCSRVSHKIHLFLNHDNMLQMVIAVIHTIFSRLPDTNTYDGI